MREPWPGQGRGRQAGLTPALSVSFLLLLRCFPPATCWVGQQTVFWFGMICVSFLDSLQALFLLVQRGVTLRL